MSTNYDREMLKERYKKHFRELKEVKKRVYELQQKKRVADSAATNLNFSTLLENMNELVERIKKRTISVETRLEALLSNLRGFDGTVDDEDISDEWEKKRRANESLRQIKQEMGLLYSEMETHAKELNAQKTVGNKKTDDTK